MIEEIERDEGDEVEEREEEDDDMINKTKSNIDINY
jgi:hypothetical protein